MIEKVNPSHPDKIADRIAGAIVDLAYQVQPDPKIAVEVLIGHGVCHVIVETSAPLLMPEAVRAIHNAIRRIARKAGPAAVLTGDAELNGRMERLAALLDANDDAMAEYEVLGLLLGLQRRDLSTAKPRSLLTRAQMGMAAAARDEMERALSARHDARTMAAAFGVSATSLNEYFTRAYGSTIATYLRRRRMEEAATQLAQGAKVTETATYVGYANPSKFAAAFKKAYGVPPREWKHASGMGLRSV